jgi:hypothetical protein
VIWIEAVGCNIPVFVDIGKPSISLGFTIKIGMHARMYIISIQQLIKATKGVNSSYTVDISSNSISFIPFDQKKRHTLIASH